MPRTVPTIASESPGNFLTGALWNANVKAMGDFLLGSSSNGVPRFSGYQATSQSLSTGTWTSLNIDTELFDSDAGHSTVTNTSRYTATVAGTYAVAATVAFAANATGVRRVRLALNGAAINGTTIGSDAPGGSAQAAAITMSLVQLNGTTDYVEAQGLQSSGGALSTNANSDPCPSLRLFWISG